MQRSLLKGHTLVAIILFCSASLSACSGSKRADKVLDVCFKSPEAIEGAVKNLQRVSGKFGYSFSETGGSAKSELEAIKADQSIIPEGRPVQADIKRKDGAILLIASNFGNTGQELRLSLFYQQNEGENSPFFRTVLSEMATLPNAHLYPRGDDDGASPCQTT